MQTKHTAENTEASAVQDASTDVVENCRKALKAYRAEEARERFEQMRGDIFSRATHSFLKQILNGCEQHDTLGNIENLKVALRLMKLKLKAEDAS
jgi:hypothetical protein